MPYTSSVLMVHVQLALGISQRQLGAIVGVTKRTIQRWQDKGTSSIDQETAAVLAERLRPVRPDLADEVLALGNRFGASLYVPATPEALAAILASAATAGGMSSEQARAAVAAAFSVAAREGTTVQGVLATLRTTA
ncbi:MAG TPA: helix-turn-helix transcriptional regulator [Polyangiaceae bacterium]|jgi:transcriptional regulator with XRE-family HTH domain|nr:helix-turn-helix transcriptional regulator [Polyangiaceae bacterium]